MKSFPLFLVVLSTVYPVIAGSFGHDGILNAHRHRRNASPVSDVVPRGLEGGSKRCKPKPTSSPAPQPTEEPAKHDDNSGNNNTGGNNNNNGGGNLIKSNGDCGDSGATEETTATSGPNGSLDWLNCGIENGGWKPPHIDIHDLIVKDLWESLNEGNSPFEPCRPYINLFEKYGQQYDIAPIMLASFAMQESTCNPETVGGGNEQGLMQLTSDKCGDAPGGNCRDPDFNVHGGAKYFAQVLKNNGGNVLKAAGAYNGWHEDMTFGDATAAARSACCTCQNNLDYLHQLVNGWCQGINSYDSRLRLGKYFNLDVCH